MSVHNTQSLEADVCEAAGFMSYPFMYFHVHQYDADRAKSKATASDCSPLLSHLWEGSKVCRTQTHTRGSKSNPGVCTRLVFMYACMCMLGVLYPIPEKMT